MSVETVVGKEVTIYFDSSKCIHSRHCVLDRPDVFVPNVKGDWIFPDRATPAEIAMIAYNCPSGAIRFEAKDTSLNEKAPLVNTIRIRENGPLAVHAIITILGKSAGYRATLCRCGNSQNKPFCDGAHATSGFIATGEVAVKPSQPLEKRDGTLAIEPLVNGPLMVKGNQEVVTGTGKTVNRDVETHLCRCGHSQNKPYCDGSHIKVGFKS
ncbi:MAG: CDGSH iron-sulfur domain-containing protein [Enterobacteriaceae bacterium]|jgi:CDGSH-type Zn-finger protein/uncharacterized Fe-S cluster protein YjdI|nr:CDGSH iron-sulfur domain-containing protein [Enterobacteriaceae bacterium]